MNRVGYFSPFVPPEWIAAHGLRPVWLPLGRTEAHDVIGRGICPCAGALVANATCGATPETLVLTTVCDQMRYASAYLDTTLDIAPFLLNVPSTWQNPQVRQVYRAELERLGRFLVRAGGREPTSQRLRATIEQYDDRRTVALEARPKMSARQWAETLVCLRSDLPPRHPETPARTDEMRSLSSLALRVGVNFDDGTGTNAGEGIPLALIGGPLFAEDDSFLEQVERAGGRIVVDATEGGERTLPGLVDREHLQDDPLDELVRIYFDTIPDVFRRPNTRLYEWLDKRLSVQTVRGIILRRYPFCDLWHAELHRLREWSDVPVLDIDVSTGQESEASRTLGRIEAFLEMLR